MSPRPKFATVDEYFASVPAESRRVLTKIREIVRRAVPEAKEVISYQIPAFRVERVFIYVAAFKGHIGIFPPVEGDKALVKELRRFRGERGNLRFPLDQPMPYGLIRRVVRRLVQQQAMKEPGVRIRRTRGRMRKRL